MKIKYFNHNIRSNDLVYIVFLSTFCLGGPSEVSLLSDLNMRCTHGILEFIDLARNESDKESLFKNILTDDLPSPLAFTNESRMINGCRPVIYINDPIVATSVLHELFKAKEIKVLHKVLKLSGVEDTANITEEMYIDMVREEREEKRKRRRKFNK